MGASESSAGDDYHIWWATTRVLELINPGAGCVMIALEGLGRVDDTGEEYEIVDVAEYFDGDTLATATRVVASQLKHSTKHPTKAWTASRLAEKSTRRDVNGAVLSTRTVIADLAKTYGKLLADGLSREDLLGKVTISLVSNQPCDPALLAATTAAAEWSRAQPLGTRRADLLRALPHHGAVLKKLADGIGTQLDSRQTCDFFAVLDLSNVGTLGSTALERGVRLTAAGLAPDRGQESAVTLYDLVRREALPGGSRELRYHDVLASFPVADRADLYPAPARLDSVQDPFPVPGALAVAAAVVANPGSFVVAHGEAGVGKTTTFQQLSSHLPPGSVVTLFDCYGGGSYLNAGQERHSTRRFVMQVVNDLAQSLGTPLLAVPPVFEADLWQILSRRIEHAVAALDPGAVLVLAVDAADNTAFAASQQGDTSFLPMLLKLPLPPRVTVVLSARSHRLESLGAPGAVRVELTPFDPATSAAHLRRYRPEASNADASVFHTRTGGNPRTQFYVLDKAAVDHHDMTWLLANSEKTPDLLFDRIIESALHVSGADAGGRRWLALMLALSRPVDTATLAAALGVQTEAVTRFAKGLTPGVRLSDGDLIEFRDENFETRVRDSVDPAAVVEAHSRLADMFLGTRTHDPDAAAHVADHLFTAGRLDEVLQLVLAEDWPAGIPDGFRRADTQGRRLDLAARAAVQTNIPGAAVRLAVRACETASRRDTLSSLVDSHLDLVARYADSDLLRAQAMRQASPRSWLAPVHMRFAATYSRDPARHADARTELQHTEAWLRRWKTSPSEETRGWDAAAGDIACMIEAHYRLDGPAAALAQLRRLRQPKFARRVSVELAARLAGEKNADKVRAILDAHAVPPVEQAPYLAFATPPAAGADCSWIDEVIAAAQAAAVPGKPKEWQLRFLTFAARHGDRGAAAQLARHWAVPLPEHRWAFGGGDAEGVVALSVHVFAAVLGGTALEFEALVPPSLREQPPEPGETSTAARRRREQREQQLREWQAAVEPLVGVAQLACRAAIGDADAGNVEAFVGEGLSKRRGDGGGRWFSYDRPYRAWACLAAEAAVDAGAPHLVDAIADVAPRALKDGTPDLWLDLAERLARRLDYATRTADLCSRAAHQDSWPLPAGERLALLARAAVIAGRCDAELAELLFDRAVDVATGINDEAAALLAVHADLARRAELPDGERPSLAAHLLGAAEAVAPHVSESSLIPYAEVARGAARLDASTALAAVSRWDDENRIPLSATVDSALLGAVAGGGLSPLTALALDHLVEGEGARLDYLLAVLDGLRSASGTAGAAVLRRELRRVVDWIRRDVSAVDQPALAARLLAWASERGEGAQVQAALEPVTSLSRHEPDFPTSRDWSGTRAPRDAAATQLLASAAQRSYETLADDVATLNQASVYGADLRAFITTVASTTPRPQRTSTLGAIAGLSDLSGTEIVFPVLSDLLTRWRESPGVTAWARENLPQLVADHLANAWWQDADKTLAQLRAFGDDETIRRAILEALPDARPQMTARAWQYTATLLGRLCDPAEAADTLTLLLSDRTATAASAPGTAAAVTTGSDEWVARLLWSVLGHPRRAMRWRASHTVRDLLTRDHDGAREVAAVLIGHLDGAHGGAFRDPSLHFYPLSATAALLVALARVAVDKPAVLAVHLPALIRHATSTELPHVQIRELARRASLALAGPDNADAAVLKTANEPALRVPSSETKHRSGTRRVSEERRYRFDTMDTIPYWYEPLARVFDLPVDDVAALAERWILDEWCRTEDEWWNDARDLRDERAYDKTMHRHGAIPSVENLRLYLEYHAMMTAAGELIDQRRPVHDDPWDEPTDPWRDWLDEHLPVDCGLWLADLRSAVPTEPLLFGHIPAGDQWLNPTDDDIDREAGLPGRHLPAHVLVEAHTTIRTDGRSGRVYVRSALVGSTHARSLQQALAAASDPTDWKLPGEHEEEFEVDHESFQLRGWLTDPRTRGETLDEHDPYAHDLRPELSLPGQAFRQATESAPDKTGLKLLTSGGTAVAYAQQWADPDLGDSSRTFTSGSRTYVDRDVLLRYLKDTGMTLILEAQLGRQRRDSGSSDYQSPRSRLYLIDATGTVTAR